MERSDTQQESRTLGVSLIVSGVILAVSAVVCAFAAVDHMAVAATFCGPATGHCILCAVLAANLLASAGATTAGVALLGARRYPLGRFGGLSHARRSGRPLGPRL